MSLARLLPQKKISVWFFHECNLFSMFVSLRILIITISNLVLVSLSSSSSFLLFPAPSSPQVCSFSLPRILHSFTLLFYKLEGGNCFFLAPKVSIRCFKKLIGYKGIQLYYSFFKLNSITTIPDFSRTQLVLFFAFLNLSLWCIILYVVPIYCCVIYVSLILCPCLP